MEPEVLKTGWPFSEKALENWVRKLGQVNEQTCSQAL